MEVLDMRGVKIKIGDRVVYGKSDRDRPIKLGVVINIDRYDIEVLGDGNSKTGILKHSYYPRILILPKDY